MLLKLLMPLIRWHLKRTSAHPLPDLSPDQCRMLAFSVSKHMQDAPNETLTEAIAACYEKTHKPSLEKHVANNPMVRIIAEMAFTTMQSIVELTEMQADPSFEDIANNRNMSPLHCRVAWVNRVLLYNGQRYRLTLPCDTNKVSISA